MIRFDLFRALTPTAKYPKSPLDLALNGVQYDLALPDYVADVLANNASLKNGIARIDKFCNLAGIEHVRKSPQDFHALAAGSPAYARTETSLELHNDWMRSGRVAQLVIVSLPPIDTVIDVLQHLKIVEPGVSRYIRKNPHFFMHCGGFELARVVYYFTDSEREDLQYVPYRDGCDAGTERRSLVNFVDFVNEVDG